MEQVHDKKAKHSYLNVIPKCHYTNIVYDLHVLKFEFNAAKITLFRGMEFTLVAEFTLITS